MAMNPYKIMLVKDSFTRILVLNREQKFKTQMHFYSNSSAIGPALLTGSS